MEGLVHHQCSANYVPLTPLIFLERAARLFPHITSMVYGGDVTFTFTWKTTHQRCIALASALSSLRFCYGDLVASVAPNIPELYELHFGVPMAGGVLATLNPSLDATTLSLLLEELEAKFIFLDHQRLQLTLDALELLDKKLVKFPILVLISTNSDQEQASISSYTEEKGVASSLHYYNYDELLDLGRLMDNFEPIWPKHECDPIMVSYTSGSTGKPKGVVYSHRSTYLNTIGEILRSDLRNERIVFLWTADMFRANGWGFIWAMAALSGTNVCLRNITGSAILDSISMHGITHLSGHPSILVAIVEGAEGDGGKSRTRLPHKVYAHIAGVLPPYNTMARVQELGFEVIHRYGMTETLGPSMKKPLRTTSPSNVLDNIMEEFDVKDPKSMKSVPCDGKTIGEIMFRGNTLMMGYLKSTLRETEKVFEGGWFHTGDSAVKHQDGSIQLKDRAKDLIVNKGESISTLEIESVLMDHPKVLQVAVVGMPNNDGCKDDDEAPCAFVKLKIGQDANEEEIIEFCSDKLPTHMIPKVVIFGALASTSTGKVQKFVLRQVAKVASSQQSLTMLHS